MNITINNLHITIDAINVDAAADSAGGFITALVEAAKDRAAHIGTGAGDTALAADAAVITDAGDLSVGDHVHWKGSRFTLTGMVDKLPEDGDKVAFLKVNHGFPCLKDGVVDFSIKRISLTADDLATGGLKRAA